MNILRKFVWLLLTLGLLVLTVQTASPIALGLAICMVVLPLLCLPLNLLAAKKLKLSAKMPVNLRKNEDGTIELTVQNPSSIPVCLVSCRVRLENQLNGEVQSMTLSCGVWPKKSQTVRATFGSPFCGRVRLTVASVRLYDCFSLIGVKAKTDAHTASVVQPDTFPQSLLLTPSSARVEEAEDYSTERPGSDLSEIFQIRDYVPGDSPRQVHWKLSQKYGKLIVKDASLPITRSAALFWERAEKAPTPRPRSSRPSAGTYWPSPSNSRSAGTKTANWCAIWYAISTNSSPCFRVCSRPRPKLEFPVRSCCCRPYRLAHIPT